MRSLWLLKAWMMMLRMKFEGDGEEAEDCMRVCFDSMMVIMEMELHLAGGVALRLI